MAVLGAGIGGLAVAVALHRRGADVQVYERAQELRQDVGSFNLLEKIKPQECKLLDIQLDFDIPIPLTHNNKPRSFMWSDALC